MIRAAALALALALAGAGDGRPDPGGPAAPAPCVAGRSGCPCAPGRTCEPGLACHFSLCWAPEDVPKGVYAYSPEYERDPETIRALILGALRLERGARVADLGAGHGALTRPLAEVVGPEGVIWATDLDRAVIPALERARSAYPNVRVRLVEAPRDLGLDDVAPGSLDLALMINSVVFRDARPPRQLPAFVREGWRLVERARDLRYLRELRRLMAPTGELVYHIDWLVEGDLRRDAVVTLMAEAGFATPPGELPMPAHIPERTWYQRGDARSELERGFILRFRAAP